MRAEFTVEPFTDGGPGPHVEAAVEAVRAQGLTPELGPFGTAVTGPPNRVLPALAAMLEAAHRAGARRVSVQVEFGD